VEEVVVEVQGVIVLIMIHPLQALVEDIVISEVMSVLVVVEVVHGIVTDKMVEVEEEEDLQAFIILVPAHQDKATMEVVLQTNGEALVVEEEGVLDRQ
jgi:hypothetical protein